MASGHSSEDNKTDAQELAENLGIEFLTTPIEETFRTSLKMLKPAFGESDPGLAGENLQARIRGNVLMSISNKYGAIVLTTGNKSEMTTGYCTLYGDMAGGVHLLNDFPQKSRFQLCLLQKFQGITPLITLKVNFKPPS